MIPRGLDRRELAAIFAGGMVGAVLRVTSGNFLEQFDFFLFGFYANAISKAPRSPPTWPPTRCTCPGSWPSW